MWVMRFASWISKATNTHTHTKHLIRIVFPHQKLEHVRASVVHLYLLDIHVSVHHDITYENDQQDATV
jgi:hypothetical protein